MLRDGKWSEQDAAILVPGDIINIKLGDIIPADLRLHYLIKRELWYHQNLVNLIGYCADGDQRLLVYEYMPLGDFPV